MASGAARRALGLVATVAPVALAVSVALHPLLEPDVFWHLASGRWILDHRGVPRTDVLTYTLRDHPWLNFQWLFDVALVSTWRFGGADALVLATAGGLGLTAFFLVRAARAAGAGIAAASFAVTLHVLASAERTTTRPEIFSYAALAAVVGIVETVRRGGPRSSLVAIPILSAVWINVHSLAFLGPLLMLMHAGLAALEARLPERWRDGAPGPAFARSFLVTGLASAVALLANPFGSAAWTFPATLFRRVGPDREIFARILEFGRPLDAPGDAALRGFWLLLAVLLASFTARRGRIPLARIAALAPFLALALLARRNIPLFSIAAVPVLAANLEASGQELAARGGRVARALGLAPAMAAAFALMTAGAVLAGASAGLFGLYRERGLGVMPGIFPEEALDALDRDRITGRLFHDLDFGGYIAWRDPKARTFIDGRLEVAGAAALKQFVEAHESPQGWRRLRDAWNPEVILLSHSSRGSTAFLRALLSSGEWKPVHFSPEAVALVTNQTGSHAPAARPPADRWPEILAESRGAEPHAGAALAFVARPLDAWLKPTPPPSAVRRAVRLANLHLTLDDPAAALSGYEAVLAVAPRDPEALFNRGMCALRMGRREDARRWWEDARPHVDRASRALFDRALRELAPP